MYILEMSLDFDTTNPEEAKALMLKLELRQKEIDTAKAANENFLDFVRAVWPEFISGYHHKKIAEKFQLIKDKKLKRLIVNMPPRHTKSEFASYLLPAWIMGPCAKNQDYTSNTHWRTCLPLWTKNKKPYGS